MRRNASVLGGFALVVLTAAPLAAQLRVSAEGVGRSVQHRVDAGNGVELSSGPIYGVSVSGAFGPRVEVLIEGLTGSLTRDSGQAENATLTRGAAYVAVLPMPWLALRAGGVIHTFKTPIVVQRWTSLRVGAEGRLAFVGGAVTGIVRLELYPLVGVTGLDRPNRALGAASGLRFGAGVFTGELLYTFERFDFPPVGGVQRVEQLSALSVGVGVRLGK